MEKDALREGKKYLVHFFLPSSSFLFCMGKREVVLILIWLTRSQTLFRLWLGLGANRAWKVKFSYRLGGIRNGLGWLESLPGALVGLLYYTIRDLVAVALDDTCMRRAGRWSHLDQCERCTRYTLLNGSEGVGMGGTYSCIPRRGVAINFSILKIYIKYIKINPLRCKQE
jgi:hypothetical protein